MPTGYTPTAVYHSALTLPVNGDAATAPSVNDAALKYLADNSLYLKGLVDPRFTWRVLSPYDLNTTINPRSDSTSGRNVIDARVLTGSRVYTIDDTGCADGDWVLARCGQAGGFTITVLNPSSVSLAVLGNTFVNGSPYINNDWCLFLRLGGVWLPFAGRNYIQTIFGQDLFVEQDATVAGNADVGGNLAVGGAATVNSLTSTNAITASNGIDLSGTMAGGFVSSQFIGQLRCETKPDSVQTISRNTVTVCVPVGSSPYTWTIFGTGQADGDWVIVRCNSTGQCTLKEPGGGTLALIDGNGVTTVNAMCVRIGGVWYVAFTGRG